MTDDHKALVEALKPISTDLSREAIAAIESLSEQLEQERESLIGITNAWKRDYEGEKARGDAWMADCKKAEAERDAAVAEAVRQCEYEILEHIRGDSYTTAEVLDSLLDAIRALSPAAGGMVLVPREALRVLEAAKVLTPLLEEGWDEYDTPDDQNIGARACEELQAATKAMLAATKEKP
jgi:hypothetical protein